jgi:hypothetical protein
MRIGGSCRWWIAGKTSVEALAQRTEIACTGIELLQMIS